MTKSDATPVPPATSLITDLIADLGDWRGDTLSRIRKLILDTDPRIIEEWKWTGTPVWSRNGILCTGETYKNIVKLTFIKGASLKDPKQLFNSSLEGKTRRAIDICEGETINETAFQALIRQAVSLNTIKKSRKEK